jgi:type II secretory ATPase GspE/PulE/Tfp pilus assembly ATPase PilB-like protein
LCAQCKKAYRLKRTDYDDLVTAYGAELFARHGLPEYSRELLLMRPGGCEACDGTGYRGRIAIHELLVNSPAIRAAVKRQGRVDEIEKIAIDEGMTTLRMDGIQKVLLGMTTIEQINRVSL